MDRLDRFSSIEDQKRQNEVHLWSKYIEAQKKLLELLSTPLGVEFSETSDELVRVKLRPPNDPQDIVRLLTSEMAVRSDQIYFDEGFFLLPIDRFVSKDEIERINTLLQPSYARIVPKPAIDGFFKPTGDTVNSILAELLPDEASRLGRSGPDGTYFLTVNEIKQLDILLEKHPTITRDARIGCVYTYQVSPIARALQQLIRLPIDLRSSVSFEKEADLKEKFWFRNEFSINDHRLSSPVEETMATLIGLKKAEVSVYVFDYLTGENIWRTFAEFEQEEPAVESENFGFRNALKAANFWFNHILPTRQHPKRFSPTSLKVTYQFDRGLLRPHLQQLELDLHEDFLLAIEQKLSAVCVSSGIHHDPVNRRLSFDIIEPNELVGQLQRLAGVPNLQLDHRGSEQRLKIRFNYASPLRRLAALLDEHLPEADYTFDPVLEVLRLFSARSDDGVWKIINQKLRSPDWTFEQTSRSALYDTYGLFYDAQQRRTDDNQRFKSLTGCDIEVNGQIIGQVRQVNLPWLDVNRLPEAEIPVEITSVRPVFTGEYERIFRLNEVLNSVQGRPSVHPPNSNVSRYLFDSSQANPLPGHLQPIDTCVEWQEMKQYVWAKGLNESQLDAIFKATYATELALIQGPPGTGKSTAIAELVWQLIRVDPKRRLLLTSEAHLAVDNAMEKLANASHNLIKPVRFGSEEKLEAEGARFSYERLQKWAFNDPQLQSEADDNILVRWHRNICQRSLNHDDPDTADLRQRWVRFFGTNQPAVRQLLMDQYVQHVNVIGATSGSIGWKGSKGKPTSFFRNWVELYPKDARKPKNPIRFDTVIIDEASKATPPELALPMLYASKTIVVGDHRQLPPMLDEGDFIETLERIGENELARFFRQQNNRQSLFEKLFLNPYLSLSLRGTFNRQYRMHPAINEVIKQFYEEDGGLICGLDEYFVNLPKLTEPQSRYHGLSAPGLFDENTHCVWIDVTTPEVKDRTSRLNLGEVRVIRQILQAIAQADGFEPYMAHWRQSSSKPEEQEVGIISFYGSQLKHLRQMTVDLATELPNLPIRLSTVDRFQGMERNIVIVSLVRSDRLATTVHQVPDWDTYPLLGYQAQSDLGFAEFPNRLNVALSRAKRLLIIVGNAAHFGRKPIYQNVYQAIARSPQGRLVDGNALLNA